MTDLTTSDGKKVEIKPLFTPKAEVNGGTLKTSTGEPTLATVDMKQEVPVQAEIGEKKFPTHKGMFTLAEIKQFLANGILTLGHLGDDALAILNAAAREGK